MNVLEAARETLLAHLDGLARADGAVLLRQGQNLAASRVTLLAGDAVAVAVAVEASERRTFGSSRILYGVAEIQAISTDDDGVNEVADALLGLDGWQSPPDLAPGSEYPGVIRGMFLTGTATDQDDDGGAVVRTYRYSLIFGRR